MRSNPTSITTEIAASHSRAFSTPVLRELRAFVVNSYRQVEVNLDGYETPCHSEPQAKNLSSCRAPTERSFAESILSGG
jgi:hypothetical protein